MARVVRLSRRAPTDLSSSVRQRVTPDADRDVLDRLKDTPTELARGVQAWRPTVLITYPSCAVALAQLQLAGTLRLRLSAVADAARICEVAIPGSRRAERDTTLVSALGREVLLSLMPEAGALATRGAYLTEGDYPTTGVVR